MKFWVAILGIVGILLSSTSADARKMRNVSSNQPVCQSWDLLCGAPRANVSATPTTANSHSRNKDVEAQVVGGRPAGCPHRFCGCGASIYLFGKIIPHLNLAANWLKFPSAAPAPRMAAARRGHVFVLIRHVEGSKWVVHDSNSGRGRTRIHVRSIAGYKIVNPSA